MASQYESEKDGTFLESEWCKGLQMVQFEGPRHWKSPVSFYFEVGRIPLFPLLTLWGNKNWPPSMKANKLENFQNKRALKGCKWSRLNTPGTGKPQSHPLLGLEEFPFPIIDPLG